jgi:hypothetical protein
MAAGPSSDGVMNVLLRMGRSLLNGPYGVNPALSDGPPGGILLLRDSYSAPSS